MRLQGPATLCLAALLAGILLRPGAQAQGPGAPRGRPAASQARSTPVATGHDFLELRLPSPPGAEPSLPVPFHLVFPDSVAGIGVRGFLEAPKDRVEALLANPLARGRRPSASERHFLLGLRALADGRPQDAHGALAQALPGLSEPLKEVVRIDAALLLYLAGMPEEAEKEWRRALENAGGSRPGRVSRNARSGRAGAREQGGPQEGAWRNLYSLFLSRRDFARAHRLVDDALQASPGNRWARMAKGFLLRMLGTPDQWEDYLRDKSTWKDSLHGIQIAYGRFLAEQGQWAEAVKYYNRGLEGAPANGQAWLELADAYYRLEYLVFAEDCLRTAFAHGISDPYGFELYGKVLVAASEVADTGNAMRGLGFRLDTAWASRQWQRAEKIVEDGLPKALHSRSMAQLLYRIYCRNGKVEAARNLRTDLWFHFLAPAPPARPPRLGRPAPRPPAAPPPRVSYVTYPLVRRLQVNDFYELF